MTFTSILGSWQMETACKRVYEAYWRISLHIGQVQFRPADCRSQFSPSARNDNRLGVSRGGRRSFSRMDRRQWFEPGGSGVGRTPDMNHYTGSASMFLFYTLPLSLLCGFLAGNPYCMKTFARHMTDLWLKSCR